MEQSKFRITLNLLKSRGLYFFLILGIISVISDFNLPGAATIGFMFLYVVFDIIGYESVKDKGTVVIQSFRIIAMMFYCTLVPLLTFRYTVFDAAAFIILHWTGWFDYLYYKISRDQIPGIWTWLTWTPLGMLYGDKGLKDRVMKMQMAFGILLAILILLLKWSLHNG